MRPAISAQPKEKSLRYENVSSATAEEGVIRLLMLDPTLASLTGELKTEDFSSPFLAKLYEMVQERCVDGRSMSLAILTSELPPEEASHLTEIMQKPENMQESEKAMSDYIEKIKTEKLKKISKDNLLAVQEKLKEKKGYGG